jgi:putative nucleotidyltransferase with HDIG domain
MNPDMIDISIQATAAEIFGKIVGIARNTAIYPSKHPIVMGPAGEVASLLNLMPGDSPQITFHIVNSELYCGVQLLTEETIKYSQFIQYLAGRGIQNFSFQRKVSPEEIARFFAMLVGDRSESLDQNELRKGLKDENICGVEFNSLVAFDLTSNLYDMVKSDSTSPAANSYHDAVGCLENAGNDIVENGTLDSRALQMTISSLIEYFLQDRSATLGVMSIKNYDKHLFHHSVNVAITALLIAKKLSFDPEQMRLVGLSGLLHDLGKLKIPREIISKPGRLSEAEWSMIRRHPIEGALMLMRYEDLSELPVIAALEHHAGYDLSGYPTLKGKSHPHIFARIVGIADVYEAMTANRSYRHAQTVDTAIKALLNGSGGQFDPLLVKLLLSITGVFPPGSIVRLVNGATAIVVEPNEDSPYFPKVKILEANNSLSADSPLINTAADPAKYAVSGVADSSPV